MRISDWSSDVCSSDLDGGLTLAQMGKGLGESGSRHDFKKDVGHPRLRHARLDGAAQRTKALGFIKLVEGRDHNPGLVCDRLETQVRIDRKSTRLNSSH